MCDVLLMYHSLLWCIEQSSSIDRISDVEWVVISTIKGVVPSTNEEGIGSASLHNQFWDECAIDVPGNAPASLSYVCNTWSKDYIAIGMYI